MKGVPQFFGESPAIPTSRRINFVVPVAAHERGTRQTMHSVLKVLKSEARLLVPTALSCGPRADENQLNVVPFTWFLRSLLARYGCCRCRCCLFDRSK